MKKSTSTASFVLLHVLLMIYSVTGICSKLASAQAFMSLKFCIYYGLEILLLAIYAIGWQQAIKKLPLTTAYANKAVTVLWGAVWGVMLFRERITWGHAAGIALAAAGVILYSAEHEETRDER